MLSNAAVKAARPRARAYKMFDERGLHLHVAPSGRATWRLKYRLAGAEQLLTIGSYPEISLQVARDHAELARVMVERGEKPGSPSRRAAALARVTFEHAARTWHAHKLGGWSAEHAGDVLDSLARDVFPAIGALPLGEIQSRDVLELLEAVEGRGRIETARRLRQRISDVFALAISRGQVATDPAAIVVKALAPTPLKRRQPALLRIEDARALIAATEDAPGPAIVKLASLFLALTAVRLGTLRGATWREIEDLDGAAPLWRVPAARMKLTRAKKADSTLEHLVPLAPAAVAVLRAARQQGVNPRLIGGDALIFPGAGGARPIGEGAIGALYARAGFAGRHVPHGWRASFSTIMNKAMPAERFAIDQVLAHTPKDKVEAAYNRDDAIERRRAILERWAMLLTGD
ncbi:MAG: integrase arm-type DNA-binding domain-containing protein [Sphingomonas sp.]|uniref:tyrosine-type recombinase/integrase n=1 Tax=Sphingomonas sp. TaxID=28214 RepID=UPI0035A8DD20|nr:integrase arm-type DNA-binding domain-containing protein [Sphingomonas sp.]